jgi:PKD repeat protein
LTRLQLTLVSLFVLAAALAWPNGATAASTLPAGFQETTVFSGLTNPTIFRFSSDGRVFVAEKSGIIKVFSSLSATTPTIVADLSAEVDNYWDRGLLGMALDPNFPTSPYLYVLYTYDAPIGGTAPTWNDACPTPPGPTTDGCVVSGRLSRLTLSGNVMVPGSEKVLIEGWCQQYPSHSIGDLQFGPDGALYVSGGDGASFNFADYGQGGGSLSGTPTPKNPCGDPPGGVGATLSPPTAEGGALRSQSLRRAAGEGVLLNGAILRVDPSTGAALPTNPLYSSSDPNAQRIVAYGFRNPFRFTLRPMTTDLWVGDVGWNDWEEIDRSPNPTSSVLNFGWPCYEGVNPQPGYQSAGLNLCTSLYSAGTATAPYYTYNHAAQVVPGETCATSSGSSITGVAFYTGGSYPSSYTNGLFFADYSRQCIWFMRTGINGLPDPTQISDFAMGSSSPVDLEIGPNGDLFYDDFTGGTIRRITYVGGNSAPTAVATASPTSGTAPLTVQFDGSGSYDPDVGDTITYSWDLNGDGVYGDSTAQKPTYTYSSPGTYMASLKVTDSHGASSTSAPITIVVSGSGTGTFGTTSPGALTDAATANYKEVSQYTAVAGNVTKVTGYVSGLASTSGSQPVRAVLYADSGGRPGALLGVSNEVLVPAGQPWGWVDFVFPQPVPVQAGPIWMGYIAGGPETMQMRYDSVSNNLAYNVNSGGYAAGASNPFGTPTIAYFHYSIYATYTTTSSNNPPTAVATASPTSGTAPLTVQFDGSGSYDPDVGDTITYSWDLNGDGVYGDSTAQKPTYTYSSPGTYMASLKVTDSHGASSTSAPITIVVSGSGTGTFGTTSPGALTDAATANYKEVSQYTAVAGNVTKVTGYVSGLASTSGSQPVRAVLYADSGGRPGALLGVSNEVLVPAGQPWGWVDFVFPQPVPVQAGPIWMGYIAGGPETMQMRYDSVSNNLAYNVNSGGYAAGASNPFGTPTIAYFHYSIYATYTTTTNTPPAPTIDTPPSTLTYSVGDTINFSGHATDAEDGTIPPSGLTWTLIIHHCPTPGNCHLHYVQTWTGVSSGSFQAPDHDYPSYLELQLTAVDSQGATASTSVFLQPNTVDLTFASNPAGAQITVGSQSGTAPYTRTVVVGSLQSISAADPQTIGSDVYLFSSWSDGGARTHNITAPATATTYTASYTKDTPPIAVATASPTSGNAPLTVQFNGSGSSDPDSGDTITYSWDLNGDGIYGDSTAQSPAYTYTTAGTYSVHLLVTDNHGASSPSSAITITVNAVTGTFGSTTIGSSIDALSANLKEVSQYTAVASNVTKLTGYISGLGKRTGSQVIRAVIYSDANGSPGALLGVSNEVSVKAGQAWRWVDFTFPAPVPVAAGRIWMGYLAGTTSGLTQVRYDLASSVERFNKNSYSAGPSNPFGTATTGNERYSLYATYRIG